MDYVESRIMEHSGLGENINGMCKMLAANQQ